jgi:glycosyltransferase involved in cell wall biosynthesis
VITPEAGALVQPGDPQELSDAIRNVLADQTRWEELSTNARERAVVEYDWAHIAARFIAAYHSIV